MTPKQLASLAPRQGPDHYRDLRGDHLRLSQVGMYRTRSRYHVHDVEERGSKTRVDIMVVAETDNCTGCDINSGSVRIRAG
jgi:hypothetical protein